MVYGSGLSIPQRATKRKIFVSYHHRGDQQYYEIFAKQFSQIYDLVYDNSLDRRIDSDNVEYIIRKIREDYIVGSSCTVVLVGKETWARKFLDWEIDATLQKQHGLIGVCLPSARVENKKVIVPGRLHENIVSGYAIWTDWASLTQNPGRLQALVEEANARPKNLIRNTTARRTRNASA